MTHSRHVHHHVITIAALLFSAGCGSSYIGDGTDMPHVDVITPGALVIGQPLKVFGRNFLSAEDGRTRLVFEGVYYTNNGRKAHAASFMISPRGISEYPDGAYVDGIEIPRNSRGLRLNRFGPYQVPFNNQIREPGRFEGTIKAVNIYADGTTEEDPYPGFFQLQVNHSVVINRLAPIVPGQSGKDEVVPCDSPALRVFGGVPYFIEVEAIGTSPVKFAYAITQGSVVLGSFSHVASGNIDRIGLVEGEEVVFDTLPDNRESDLAVIAVTVTDAAGGQHETVLPIPVVRPLQLITDGVRKLAEYYEPEIVAGPIIGALATSVSYSESDSESRQTGVSVNVSKNFSDSHGISSSENWSEGISITDSTSTGTSSSVSHSEHEDTSESYGTSYSHSEDTRVGHSTSNGTSWSANFNGVLDLASLVSIPGLSATLTGGPGWSSSEEDTWSTTTSDATSNSFSNTYATGTQDSISNSTTESQAHSNSTTYSMGGSQGISENYTVGESESWGETWSSSSGQSENFSYSSSLPRDRCAMVYRQTIRFVRQATLVAHDMCGVRSTVANMTFNEWSWAPNITIADSCYDQKVPPSTQPPAQCFIACD